MESVKLRKSGSNLAGLVLSLTLQGSNAFDYLSTNLALSNPRVEEVNPVMRYGLDNEPLGGLFKIGGGLALDYYLRRLRRKDKKEATIGYLGASSVFVLAGVNNVYQGWFG